MRLLGAISMAALALGGGAAHAACAVEDLAGKWTVNQTIINEICGIDVDEEGEFDGTCRTYVKGKVKTSKTVSGVIDVSEKCTIEGRLKKGNTVRSFGGKVDADTSMMVGVFFRRSGFVAYRNN